tara:strand:- start:6881 stop:7084 length:204 start_codon:yes stop_codon:yes gene_type:complete
MVNPYLYIIFNQRYGYKKPKNNDNLEYNKNSTHTRCVNGCIFRSIYMGWNYNEIEDCIEKCKWNKNK